MKTLIFAAFIVAIRIVPAEGLGHPEQRIAQSKSATGTEKTTTSNQNQQPSESESVDRLIREIRTQEQQNAQERKAQEDAASQDVGIQRKLTKFTGELVAVGVLQSLVLLTTAVIIYLQILTMIGSERAWILADTGIIPDDFEPDPNKVGFLEIRPVVTNYGKTPAQITRMAISEIKVPTDGILPPEPEHKNEQAVNIVLPPDTPIQPLRILIDQKDFIRLREGNPVLYIYGFIDYIDFGKKSRTSRFCFVYNVPSGFVTSKRGFYIPANVPEAYTKCT